MNTPSRTIRSAVGFALSTAFTLAMLSSVGALFGGAPQAPATELARSADAPTQVIVVEGQRVAPTQVVVIEAKRIARS